MGFDDAFCDDLEWPLLAHEDIDGGGAFWTGDLVFTPPDARAPEGVGLDWQLPAANPVGGAAGLRAGSEQTLAFPEGFSSTVSPPPSLLDSLQYVYPLDLQSPATLPPSLVAASESDARSEDARPDTPPQNPKIPISRLKQLCCGREYEPHALRIHRQRHHFDKRKWPLARSGLACSAGCGVSFRCQRSLDRHLRTACRLAGGPTSAQKPVWQCACTKSFVRWDKFLTHKCGALSGRGGIYTCVCEAEFSDRALFEQHHKTEIGKAGRKSKKGMAVQ